MNEEKNWQNMLTYTGFCEIIFYNINSKFCDTKREMGNVDNMTNHPLDIKNDSLETLNVSLREITYYLVGFFYKTGKKYSCTQTKLGKLLSILAFRYAVRGMKLFEAPIYKYPPMCGTLIKELASIISKDVYTRDLDQGNPDFEGIITEEFGSCVEMPIKFKDVKSLSPEIMMDIETLFIYFGAYPAEVLGNQLNSIVDKVVDIETDEINLCKLRKLKKSNFDTNEIIEYIYQGQ